MDLKAARRLGQRAVKQGLDFLSLARVHDAALAGLEKARSPISSAPNIDSRSREFFGAAVLPLQEKTNRPPRRRTDDPVATNGKPRTGISRRKEVEGSGRTGETTASLDLTLSDRLQEEPRSLYRRFLTVEEDERRRISRELHDLIARPLVGINVHLAVLRSRVSENAMELQEAIEVAERLVGQSVEIVYRIASDLRPVVLDDLGLIPALQSSLKSFRERTHLPTRLTALPAVERLDPPARTALFRIAQEALANVALHARASRVTLDLRPGKACVRMKVHDDGKGFDAKGLRPDFADVSWGLFRMRERAEMVGGSLRIESTTGEGTTLWVEVPRRESEPANRSEPGENPPKTSP